MRPPEAKRHQVAAFISNCRAASFRLAALEQLLANPALEVHSYGRCAKNADTAEDKAAVLRRYHFSLAFENSQVGGASGVLQHAAQERPTCGLSWTCCALVENVPSERHSLQCNPLRQGWVVRWTWSVPLLRGQTLILDPEPQTP